MNICMGLFFLVPVTPICSKNQTWFYFPRYNHISHLNHSDHRQTKVFTESFISEHGKSFVQHHASGSTHRASNTLPFNEHGLSLSHELHICHLHESKDDLLMQIFSWVPCNHSPIHSDCVWLKQRLIWSDSGFLNYFCSRYWDLLSSCIHLLILQ